MKLVTIEAPVLPEHADEALLRAAVNAVTEQIDILRRRASHYACGAEDTEGEPLRWASFRGQAIAYEVAAVMIADALAKTYDNPPRLGTARRNGPTTGAP